jgi:hypothetical protein
METCQILTKGLSVESRLLKLLVHHEMVAGMKLV